MKWLLILFILFPVIGFSQEQNLKDTLSNKMDAVHPDDPSQFFTRVEFFNDFQNYGDKGYINFTTIRGMSKLGKRFNTRIDIPFTYCTFSPESGNKQFGLGDISFRLLGYKIIQTPKTAVTASVELVLNTAQSPVLGLGKNIIMPVISYSRIMVDKRVIGALAFQQAYSFSGDESRGDINFSKLQVILINIWSRKMWTVLAPEFYLDYENGGASMNIEGRLVYAPKPRLNVWVQPGIGVFGDFFGRYQWSVETGIRYFMFRN